MPPSVRQQILLSCFRDTTYALEVKRGFLVSPIILHTTSCFMWLLCCLLLLFIRYDRGFRLLQVKAASEAKSNLVVSEIFYWGHCCQWHSGWQSPPAPPRPCPPSMDCSLLAMAALLIWHLSDNTQTFVGRSVASELRNDGGVRGGKWRHTWVPPTSWGYREKQQKRFHLCRNKN